MVGVKRILGRLRECNNVKRMICLEEMEQIADVMRVTFEQVFIFPDGETIKIES